jgi:hypothetical protein
MTGGSGMEDDLDQALAFGARGPEVTALQMALSRLDYPVGAIDGVFGTLTRGALLSFQADNALPTTGAADSVTLRVLGTAGKRPLDPARTGAEEKDVAEDGSRIILNAGRSRLLATLSSIFGALGIGNSAIVNAAGGSAVRATTAPEKVTAFLREVEALSGATAAIPVERAKEFAAKAGALREALTQGSVSPEALQLLEQLRRLVPQDLLTKNPDLKRFFESVDTVVQTKPAMTTIFDILPTFFANDTVLQTLGKGIAAVAGSTLPGFGGSLAVLGIGLASRLFANSIASARVEDHRRGLTISR